MNDQSLKRNTFTEMVIEVFRVNGLLLDAGDRLTRPLGLSSARWQVLGVVEHGPAPVAHVARIMGLTRQSVQQSANALERDGFIEFVANPHHRRAKLMLITPKGHDALAQLQQHQTEWADQMGGKHRLEDLQTAVAILRQVREDLEHS
jgi:DNA-binding MarR family transcriptional regulator